MDDSVLQELLDKQSITERLLDYARGVDRIDRELICSVFHDGARLDYGAMFVGIREEFADFIAVIHPIMEAHSHHLSNIYITVEGDRAGSETYVVARLRSRAPDGALNDTVSS
jgi:SnoaL-like domain